MHPMSRRAFLIDLRASENWLRILYYAPKTLCSRCIINKMYDYHHKFTNFVMINLGDYTKLPDKILIMVNIRYKHRFIMLILTKSSLYSPEY